MQVLNCIIIDDDVQACNALQHDLIHFCSNIHIAGIAHSVAQAVQLINAIKPHFILLDIKLGDGSGFDVLKQINHSIQKIIFITAYNEYAIQAFKVNALDYLLKPIDGVELQLAVNKVKDFYTAISNIPNEQNKLSETSYNRISFNTTDGISVHEINSIIFCEASRNYCTIHFTNSEKILIAKPLSELQTILRNKLFERIHQSYLINLVHLKKFSNKDGGFVTMTNEIKLPVARRKKADLLHLLDTITV